MLAVTSLSQAQLFIKMAQTCVLSSGEMGLGKQVMLWVPCGTDCNVSDQQRSVCTCRGTLAGMGAVGVLQCSFMT